MRNWIIAAFVAAAAACTPAAEQQELRPLAYGESSLTGVVTAVEDGGYPQFTVTLTHEGGEPRTFYLVEPDADLDGASAGDFLNLAAVVYYTSGDDHMISDIRDAAGASLVQEDAQGAAPTDGASITGTLSGAEAITTSDLPDIITVTDGAGAAVSFEYYVDDRVMAANGQQVTVHYTTRTRDQITLMRPQLN